MGQLALVALVLAGCNVSPEHGPCHCPAEQGVCVAQLRDGGCGYGAAVCYDGAPSCPGGALTHDAGACPLSTELDSFKCL